MWKNFCSLRHLTILKSNVQNFQNKFNYSETFCGSGDTFFRCFTNKSNYNINFGLFRKQINSFFLLHTTSTSMANTKLEEVDTRQKITSIFESAVNSVLPGNLINNKLIFDSKTNILKVEEMTYQLNNNLYVVGFGKAVLGMARAIEDMMPEQIVTGIISIPIGLPETLSRAGKCEMLLTPNSKFKVYEGAENNLPDERSLKASEEIQSLISSLQESDILLVLISGGGSALLPSPIDPITLKDEMEVIKLLSNSGATIAQMNGVRRNIERLKGGGLAELAYPAKVISLILSDVIGDDLETIGSGPTVENPTTPDESLTILQRLGVKSESSDSVITVLKSMASSQPSRTSANIFKDVQNVLVGNNELATTAAKLKATEFNFMSYVLTNTLVGESRILGQMFAKLVMYVCLCSEFASKLSSQSDSDLNKIYVELMKFGLLKSSLDELRLVVNDVISEEKDICLICGGESTVTVRGNGKGGRNQELALATAIEIDRYKCSSNIGQYFSVSFASIGTDGQDGPTDSAGAFINDQFIRNALKQGLDPVKYLDNNDSYTLFSEVSNGQYSLKTGLTGTNIMDIQLLVIQKVKQF